MDIYRGQSVNSIVVLMYVGASETSNDLINLID